MRIPTLVLTLFVCATAAAQRPCTNYSFDAPPVRSPEGYYHLNLIDDIDGDGRMDIATTVRNGGFVIRYGEGSGVFSEPQTLEGAVSGVADVVGDSLPDLLGGGQVYENRGGRHFSAPVALPARGRNIVGDFNGDGRSDLLIAHADNQLLVLRRTAEGTLEPESTSSMGADATTAVMDGDFDGDGDLDIAASTKTTAVRVFDNNGDGTFVAGAVHTTTVTPEVIAAGDLDRDGRSDVLALTNLPLAAGTAIEVFYGSGRKATFPVNGRALYGARLLVTQLNPDAAPDVLVSVMGPDFNGVYVFMNDGSGALRDVQHLPLAIIYDIAAGDANGDGHTDLLLPRLYGQELLPGRGTGTFDTPRPLADVHGYPHSVTDLDHDGIDELVYLTYDAVTTGHITIRWSESDGSFRSERLPRYGVQNLTSTSDGLAAYDPSNKIVYMMTVTNGVWHERRLPVSPDGWPSMHVVDVNRDGAAELVMIDANTFGETVSVTAGRENRVLSSLFLPNEHITNSVTFDDMNGDGLTDLLLAFSGTQDPAWGVPTGTPLRNGSIALFAGQADGSFSRAGDLVTGVSPRQVSTGDFNGDGRRDVLLVTFQAEVLVMYGNAAGVSAPQMLADDASYIHAVSSDFDGNGISDVVVASVDSFRSFRGTTAGVVENGRFSSSRSGMPLAVRMRGKAPSLIFPTRNQVLTIESTCMYGRRRSVR